MRKNIRLITIIFGGLLLLSSCGTTRTAIDSPETKTKNIITKSDKNSNFIKANEWMVEAFNNAESVIQFTDKEAGIVKGKYIMKEGIVSTSPYQASTQAFYAVITIRVKDEGSRIEITPPSGMYSQKVMNIEYGFTPELFNNSADVLIASFEEQMLSKSENDSW